MKIPYRTRLRLQRIGSVVLLIVLAAILAWFCWVVWLERYVIYTNDGAIIDFERSSERLSGVVARPPSYDHEVDIYFNEGDNAIETQAELTQMAGYYVTIDDLLENFDGVKKQLTNLPNGTPVMLEVKSRYGYFYYPSNIEGVQFSSSVNVEEMGKLIDELRLRGLYLIAKVPAYRDYLYGLNHTDNGLPVKGGYLWMDDEGYYWLKPKANGTMGFLTSIILELKEMGFHEVVLGDFKFPASDRIVYKGDKTEDIISAAKTLVSSCSSTYFAVSFIVEDPAFPLPEGRTRLYLSGVEAKEVGARASQVKFENPEARLVFFADTNDTRFDQYGVLRPIEVSGVLEAQKADQAADTEAEEQR